MLHIDSLQPINRAYGVYQGTPIARYYIDRHMADLSTTLSGFILEFGSPTYSKDIDCKYEIMDINEANRQATIHGDICDQQVCSALADRYDCIICTTVLQLVPNPQKAVENMHMMLKPGGSLIVAEKALSQIDPWSAAIDRWRFTPHGLEHLMRGFTKVEQIEPDKLAFADPSHPMVTIAHGQK
jgi:SAM-dependent methyltransferase